MMQSVAIPPKALSKLRAANEARAEAHKVFGDLLYAVVATLGLDPDSDNPINYNLADGTLIYDDGVSESDTKWTELPAEQPNQAE